ncbi:MAG: hypothetical protein FJ145_13025 [Deltaproteobacteria bacterium]|nr:hypothetical protein [Deltaproteobacteria bacterium]
MLKSKILPMILSAVLLLLVVVNVFLQNNVQSTQAELSDRQQTIAQTVQIEALYRQVVTVLANLAVQSKDEQLRNLLVSSGINLGGAPEAPAPKK